MVLVPSPAIPPTTRARSLHMIAELHEDWLLARQIEAAAHALSKSRGAYTDMVQRIIFNLHNNPNLTSMSAEIVLLSDHDMARGTLIEDIERENRENRERFDQIVQEKYQLVNKASYKTTLRCRRCGSGDVQCDQKQTRGADESMTVFATCNKCSNRWTMR